MLKSSSTNLGAVRLAQLCEKIECDADVEINQNNQEKALELIQQIQSEYQRVEKELEAELSRPDTD